MSSKLPHGAVTMKSRVLRARVNVSGEGEVVQSLTTERETSERMQSFSLQYGGMWQEFYEQLQAAKSRAADAELSLIQVVQERDLLRFEKEELSLKFKDNLLSLTQQESTHLEATAILQQIRQEKEYLLQRLTALEDHANYVEKLNRELQGSVSHWQEKVYNEQEQHKAKENQVNKQHEKVQYLEHELRERDRRISELEASLQQQGQEKKTLQKALDNKMKQCSLIMKEKNALKDDYETLQANVKTGSRAVKSLAVDSANSAVSRPSSSPRGTLATPQKSPTSSMRGVLDVRKTLFASPIKVVAETTAVSYTPDAVADLHAAISPSVLPPAVDASMLKVTLQELVDEGNKTNPWCQPPSPLRTSYRKASTPTQMRRRAAATAGPAQAILLASPEQQ